MARSETQTGRRPALRPVASAEQSSIAPFDTVLSSVAAGQTAVAAGTVRNDVSLGQGALLTEAAGGALSIFGALAGPASGLATIAIAAGATLYAAGSVEPTLVAAFAGPAGTLELANLYLPAMSAAVAGFSPGEVIDIISGTLTDALLAPVGPGGTLTLMNEGTVVAALTLADGVAGSDAAFAVPDPVDGTRILLGPAMPATSAAVAAGSAGGSVFQWGGAPGGRWADQSLWRTAGGGVTAIAPGARDTVQIAGPQSSMLVVAGNAAAAALTTQGLVALAGAIQVGTLTAGASAADALLLTAGCALDTGAATLRTGILQVAAPGAVLTGTGMLTLQAGTLWTADGGQVGVPGINLAGGVVRIGSAGAICVGGGASLAGSLSIASGAVLSGFGAVDAPVQNDGTIQAVGTLQVYGALGGQGAVAIAGGAELYLPDGAGAGQQIAFGSSAGTLELFGSAGSCAATVSGFGVGDVVDIASQTISQAVWTPGTDGLVSTLDLGQAGTLDILVASGLTPANAAFALAPDGFGGTAVEMVPCFCSGTRLACPGGTVAVEDVAIGDRLITAAGAARLVRWIGVCRYDAETLTREKQLRPVRIRAGALGGDLPTCDVRLSPLHAIALSTPIGKRLIPVVALVNGRSILRELPVAGVTYFHIELDRHDLLFSAGLSLESFSAAGPERRALFQAAFGSPLDGAVECLARLDHGPFLEKVRAHLGIGARDRAAANGKPARWRGAIDRVFRRGGELSVAGWAADSDLQEAALWLDIIVGGYIRATVVANHWRPDVDRAGIGNGASGFIASFPHPSLRELSTTTLEIRCRQPVLTATRACDRVIGAARCSPWSDSRSGNSPRLASKAASSTRSLSVAGSWPEPALA